MNLARRLARLLARFPRLAHFVFDPYTESGIALFLWGSALGSVAVGTLSRQALLCPALVLSLASIYRLASAALTAATCPCNRGPALWDQVPQDQVEGGER